MVVVEPRAAVCLSLGLAIKEAVERGGKTVADRGDRGSARRRVRERDKNE